MRSSASFAWLWKENPIFQWLTFFDDSNDDAWIGWEDRKQEDKRMENL